MRKIEITATAQKDIEELLQYLESKWSKRTQNTFVKKLSKIISILKDNPESFPRSENNLSIYKCVVTKQSTIYYRFNSKKITIIALIDTRQHPTKINKIK